jgi:hypothetical protein
MKRLVDCLKVARMFAVIGLIALFEMLAWVCYSVFRRHR